MEPKYETGNIALTKILDALGNNQNGTYLIPDFQRAYVWTPIQVINLLDTLFHGWPFGSILLAQAPRAGTFFTARPLYRRIKASLEWSGSKYKLDISENDCVSQTYEPDAGYTLILDGQQRLQSLLFALSKACQGIELTEYGWLCLSQRGSGYWSRFKGCYSPLARVYLNITNLEDAMERDGNIQSLKYVFFEQDDTKPILEWCLDSETPHWRWRSGVPRNVNEVKHDHIALADIWEFTRSYIDEYDDTDNVMIKPFSEDNVKKLCSIREVDYKPALFEFCRYVSSLHNLSIPFTKISLPIPEEAASESDISAYNRSVLNIFTRLNEGGIALTKSDITLSWLKRNWDKRSLPATQCFSKQQGGILHELNDRFGIDLAIEDIVNEITYIWVICANDGKKLNQNDLMGGVLIEHAAKWISQNWSIITNAIYEVVDKLHRNQIIFKKRFGSFRAVSLLAAWKIIGELWFRRLGGTRDRHTQKSSCLQDEFNKFVTHFILAGQIVEAWGRDAVQNKLVSLQKNIENADWDDGFSLLRGTIEEITRNLCKGAIDAITTMQIDPRVSRYRNYLWIWHHLSLERAEFSSCLIREPGEACEGRRLDVDHFIARDYWISDYLPRQGINQTNPDYYTFCNAINQIGNCNIVEKTLNISMGKKAEQELHDFLVTCFGSEERFYHACKKENLYLTPEMLSLTNTSPERVIMSLEERTKKIKNDLIRYFSDAVSPLF
ncbi:MAG: DUF262 domain-containing protein [Lentisphaeria bacterium]|nr:DUF262 domain-containing protein [Lentisphaeria bacterium]